MPPETLMQNCQVSGNSTGSKAWPADRIERWPVERLIPYARNARTHPEDQVAQIAASIREWGWTNPVLVDEDGTIIAGHGRVLAARKLRILEVL
jgi:ParB-like chromosome segregation protein Spo0J